MPEEQQRVFYANIFRESRRMEAIIEKLLALSSLEGHAKPEKLSDNQEAMKHFRKGEELFSKSQFQEAIAEYEGALECDPSFAKAYLYLGDGYFRLGDFDTAIEKYEKSIQLDPGDRMARRFLGDLYERKFDSTGTISFIELAIASYEEALKIDPGYEMAKQALERAKKKWEDHKK